MLSIKKISTLNEFSKLKGKWTALLKESRADTLFLTWEWMYTWWECFQENRQLFILAVYDEDVKLVGIAPLCISKKRLVGIPVMKYIKFLGTLPISSDHLDFIIYKGMEKEILAAFVEFLFQKSRWDYCLLSNIPTTSLTGRLLKEIIGSRPFQSKISQVCPYVLLPTQIESFHSSLSRKMRSNTKREKHNLLKKYHDLDLVIWENPKNLESAMKKLFELHEKLLKSMKYNSNFIRNNVRQFHKKIASLFLDTNMLRLYFLRVQGKDVATLYAFKYNNKLFHYQSGRDPKWSKEGVGGILINLIIEDAISKGYAEFDFLRGTEDYKTRLTNKKREEIDIFISNSFSARIFLLFRNLYHKIRQL